MSFILLNLLSPKCLLTLSLKCAKYPSQEFVVLGIFKLLKCLYVNKYGMFLFKLLNAAQSVLCLKALLSFKNSLEPCSIFKSIKVAPYCTFAFAVAFGYNFYV